MISKSSFIRGLQCLKSLYLHKKRPFLRDPLSPETRAKFKRGHEMGDMARDLFPGGVLIASSNPRAYKKNLEEVNRHIQLQTPVMYEVPFMHDDLMAIMDIVTCIEGKWSAYEVKSSLSISETYLWDITFQAFVIQSMGLKDVDFNIIHINSEYVLEDDFDIHSFYKIVNVNDEIESRMGLLQPLLEKMRNVEKITSSPDIPIGKQCFYPYECDFKGHCWKHVQSPSVFHIPGFSEDLKYQLLDERKTSLALALPFIHDVKQKNIAMSLLHGDVIVQKNEISEYLNLHEKQILFLKIWGHRPAKPLNQKSTPFQFSPVMLSMCAFNNGIIENEKYIFFDLKDNYWEKIRDFSLTFRGYDKTHRIVCFACSSVLEQLENALQRIFGIERYSQDAIDLQYVFKKAWYCAPDIDFHSDFQAVASHFSDHDSIRLKQLFKLIENAEDNVYVFSQSPAGMEKLQSASSEWMKLIAEIWMKLSVNRG